MNCFFCEGKHFKTISKKLRDSKHKVVKCNKCGLLQLSPKPSDKEDKKFYNKNRQAKNIGVLIDIKSIKKNSLNDTLRRVDLVSKRIPKNSTLLDIGSGYGFFIQEMHCRGYNVTGVEISKEIRGMSSRVTNAKVLDIDLSKDDIELDSFDCITLFHVLEHISCPTHFLKIVKKHLNRNGKLIIEVPNVDDAHLDTCKEYRDFYWQRAHLFYFNAKTLKKVVQKSGFSVVDISYVQRYGLENFMNWFILGKPQIKKPVFETKFAYKWLEDYYKEHLCETGRSDTLALIARK